MVQIVDVSDKMLYNKLKTEQELLLLINATVSHELRNPLNSLIGQICSMEGFFENFTYVVNRLS